jgi:hypothetical protein
MRSLTTLLLSLAAVLVVAAPADASFVESAVTEFVEPSGEPALQAGSHPDTVTDITTRTHFSQEAQREMPDEALRDVRVELPPGFYGNPQAVATCMPGELIIREGLCNVDSQVGVLSAWLILPPSESPPLRFPVYNMPVGEDETASMMSIVIGGAAVKFAVTPKTEGNNGLEVSLKNINEALPVYRTHLDIWGIPASPVHDPERFVAQEQGGAKSGLPLRPFTTLPARCEPLTTVFRFRSWKETEGWVTSSSTSPSLTGCDGLVFDPKLEVTPAVRQADTPTALDVDLTVPQDETYSGVGTPQLRDGVVKLPKGVALSTAAASGLGSCSDTELKLGTREEPDCPDSSKIGTVSITTPVLPKPLEGNVILGTPTPEHLVRLFLVAKGSGIQLKVPGIVQLDEKTGQLTTEFRESPQLPFSNLRLHFKGGPRAALTTPPTCGTYTSRGEFTSWADPNPVVSESSFTIDQGCGREGTFSPTLRAGATQALAGQFSAFNLQVLRDEGEQDVSRIEATLPEGLLAKLGGVPLCGDAQAASGDCPAASRVGVTTVGTGAGALPLYVPQPGKAPTAIYLSGPYKGAPYSLVVKVPAQAGPFDLGTVAVRSGIYVDPATTQVTVKSDPLPQILKGIPIAYRDIRVEIDRPGFTLTPTDCDPMRVESTIVSDQGKTANPSAPFRVSDCADLGFKPKLSLKLSGATHRSAHPKLRAVLKARRGDANIRKAVVTLPRTEFLENAHIRTVCTRVQYAADNCPKGSVYGYAKAWSPLLDKPLRGPVYLRSSNHALPDLVASLDGQIDIDLAGRIDSVHQRIRNTFWAVPDAPVSKFVLTMQGGKKGLLVNNTELCKAKPHASVEFTGHNGNRSSSNPLVKADCGKK